MGWGHAWHGAGLRRLGWQEVVQRGSHVQLQYIDRPGKVVPALPGCFSLGATVEEALAHIHEAIEVHIAGLRKSGDPVPPGDVIGPDEEIDIPATVTVAA